MTSRNPVNPRGFALPIAYALIVLMASTASPTATAAPPCVPPATVYVDDNWAGTTPGTDPDGAGPATNFGCDSFATIQDGVNGVASGGTVIVYDGTYTENVMISKPVVLKGAQFGVDARGRVAAESIVSPAA